MSKVTIIKTDEQMPEEPDLSAVRRFLFSLFDGWTDTDRKGWRKIWKRLINLSPGEFAQVEFVIPRSSAYHRRHMAIEAALFDSQERFTDFDQMRNWLKVGAGWVNWLPGAKGGIVPIPKSISYAKADQAEFEEYHGKVIAFLRGPYASHYFWPHLGDKSDEMMNSILEGFEE